MTLPNDQVLRQFAPGCVCCPKVIYASRSELEGVAKMEKGTRNGAAAEVAKLLMSAHCRRKRILAFFGESRCVCICGTTHDSSHLACLQPEPL